MHPSAALLHPVRTTRTVTGTLTRPIAGLLGLGRGGPLADLSSEDPEYLRQLAPGVTTALAPSRPSPVSARARAEHARLAASSYLEHRREELRVQLDRA